MPRHPQARAACVDTENEQAASKLHGEKGVEMRLFPL